jgi:hypothetical protein
MLLTGTLLILSCKITLEDSVVEHGEKSVKIRNMEMHYIDTGRVLAIHDLLELVPGSSFAEIEKELEKLNGWFGSGSLVPYYSLGNNRYAIRIFEYPNSCQNLQGVQLVGDTKVLGGLTIGDLS